MTYISLVRSVLGNSSSIWDPYHAKDISSIERIQRRAARFVKFDYRSTSSVTAMINDLGWKDLAHRRRELRLALLHKVVYDHIAVSADSLGLLPGDKRLRSSHKKNFKDLPTNTDPFRYSFVPRTIIERNSLPASAVECTSPSPSRLSWPGSSGTNPPGPCAHTPSALILLQEVCGLRLKTRQEAPLISWPMDDLIYPGQWGPFTGKLGRPWNEWDNTGVTHPRKDVLEKLEYTQQAKRCDFPPQSSRDLGMIF